MDVSGAMTRAPDAGGAPLAQPAHTTAEMRNTAACRVQPWSRIGRRFSPIGSSGRLKRTVIQSRVAGAWARFRPAPRL